MMTVMVSSCALIPESEFETPPPLRSGNKDMASSGGGKDDSKSVQERDPSARFEVLPETSLPGSVEPVGTDSHLFADAEPADISLAVSELPLPAFINEVFANRLGLDFEMAPEVASKKDLVTLRVSEPRNRRGIYDVALQVLDNYGVQASRQGDILRFTLGRGRNAVSEPPLIISGKALPSVPDSHRPIFLSKSLNVISNADAYSMLRLIFERQDLQIQRDNPRNAVTLLGPPALVRNAASVIDMLDRPNMKGRFSMRVEPLYTDVETLSENLQVTLSVQGYDIGGVNKAITLVPIEKQNALFVFAATEQGLSVVREWTKRLDRAVKRSDSESGFFWYRVRNTSAQQLAITLNALDTGGTSEAVGGASPGWGDSDSETMTERAGKKGPLAMGAFVVDPARNMLMYSGEPGRWQELLPLIQELDASPAQVLVEVIVAEVTLSESFRFGVEWGLSNVEAGGAVGDLTSIFGDGGVGSGAGGNGLSWSSVSNSGATRLALNAFANDNRVSVLQTPKILVRSGESASVSVGQSIPTLTSSTATDVVQDGDSALTQQVSYRDVGISLSVTPTVYSDGRIDMYVVQDVSQSIGDQSTTNLTPIISRRQIETNLSLEDGGSVLLGGLITRTQSRGNSRVPILGSIPGIGQAFRSDSTSADTTELMILIVPYLINGMEDAGELTRAFQEQLKIHPASAK